MNEFLRLAMKFVEFGTAALISLHDLVIASCGYSRSAAVASWLKTGVTMEEIDKVLEPTDNIQQDASQMMKDAIAKLEEGE